MDTKAFSNPSGQLVPDKYEGKDIFSFLPNILPPKLDIGSDLNDDIGEANHKLGRLSGLGDRLPNPNLLIVPYLKREAVLSSKIEGTQVSLAELLLFEAKGEAVPQNESKGLAEVSNYVQAQDISLARVKRGKPIDVKMILDAHRILLSGVRGQERSPGEVRQRQNWIGILGSKIERSRYVPPPYQLLPSLLMNLEGFIQHPTKGMNKLVQCAIMHYQFEAIHAFEDGNGRLGRLLITLFFCERGVLSQPLLYLSAYIDKHKGAYYDRLLNVSLRSEWNEWIEFFIEALTVQAEETIKNVQAFLALMERYESRLQRKNASMKAMKLEKELFRNPYLTNKSAVRILDVTPSTAQSAIVDLMKFGILKQVEGGKRDRVYGAAEILKLLS